MKAEEIADKVAAEAKAVLGATTAGQVRLMLSEYTDRLRESGLLLEDTEASMQERIAAKDKRIAELERRMEQTND